ncbi:MAG: SDR family oxidoreductase, partial [Acidobacteriota bacterium]
PPNRGTEAAARALSVALETNRRLEDLRLGRRFPHGAALRKRVRRRAAGDAAPDEDMLAVRSVYRVPARRPSTKQAATSRAATSTAEEHDLKQPTPSISDADLATCAKVLDALRAQPGAFFERTATFSPVRAAANRLIHAIQRESRARKTNRRRSATPRPDRQRQDRDRNARRDRELVEATGIRRRRSEGRRLGIQAEVASDAAPAQPLAHPKTCHICRGRYVELHFFYDALCPGCADLNYGKRHQSADLSGRVAVVTGGRVKIGHQIALKLLRAGATVHLTTRFPCSAAARFDAAADADDWRDRVHIVGIDLRSLPAVEGLAVRWAEQLPRLDFLINNAAQTIRRPPAFYAPLMEAETRGVDALPARAGRLVATSLSQPHAAQLSQRRLLPEDADAALFFPAGAYQEDRQPLDLRPRNSWSFELGDVSSLELLEVHAINAMAPFILLRQLQDLMTESRRRGGARGGHVVNVSAMEGSFSRAFKGQNHPHTNMAKAALNMMTRTCAGPLAERGVFVHSVDTGWITDEQPEPTRRRMRGDDGFEPPLDEIDGAARVLDPVFQDLRPGGSFWKDYRPGRRS